MAGPSKHDVRDFAALRARIVERYPEMTSQLRTIAEFALQHPEIMAVETVSRLAARLSIPPTTIVRFAQALDYGGFAEMKRDFSNCLIFHMQKRDAPRKLTPEVPADDGIGQFAARAVAELDGFSRTFDRSAFSESVRLLTEANTIYVAAQHLSYPLAALFAWTLLQDNHQCILLDNIGGFALRQSQAAGPHDVTVSISFAPYQPSVVQEAHAHVERGGKVIAITDSALSPLAAPATQTLVIDGMSADREAPIAAATCLVRALANAVLENCA